MEMESCVPPGFRFHPTEEELVGYYLARKINSLKIDIDVIVDIDLYKMEPWDIQGIYLHIVQELYKENVINFQTSCIYIPLAYTLICTTYC
jgi:hypothetical protein